MYENFNVNINKDYFVSLDDGIFNKISFSFYVSMSESFTNK